MSSSLTQHPGFSKLAFAEAGIKAHVAHHQGGAEAHNKDAEMSPEIQEMLNEMIREKQLDEAKANIAERQAFRRAKSHQELDTLFAENPTITSKKLPGNLLVKGHVGDRINFLTALEEKIKTENIAPYLTAKQSVWEHYSDVDGMKQHSKYAPQIREIYAALEGKKLTDAEITELMGSHDKSLEAIAKNTTMMAKIHRGISTNKSQLHEMYTKFDDSRLGFLGKFKSFSWAGHAMFIGTPLVLLAWGMKSLTGFGADVAQYSQYGVKTMAEVTPGMKAMTKTTGWFSGIARWLARDSFMARMIGHEGGLKNGYTAWESISKRLLDLPEGSSDLKSKIAKVGGKFLLNGKEIKNAYGLAGGLDDAVKAAWRSQNGLRASRAAGGKMSSWALGHANGIGKGILRTALGLSTKGWMSLAGVAAVVGLGFYAYEKGGIAPAMADGYETTKEWAKANLPVDIVPNYQVWA